MSQKSPPRRRPQSGFIVIWREIVDSWLWDEPPITRMVAIELLLSANWRSRKAVTKKGRVFIPRGSCIIGQEEYAKRIGVSRQQLRTAFINLTNGGFITIKSTSRGTQVFITNYDRYQNLPDPSNQPNNQPKIQSGTSMQPACNQHATTPEPLNHITKEPKGGGAPPPPRLPKKSRPKSHPNRQQLIDAYHELHVAAIGVKPTWSAKQRGLADDLAKRGVEAPELRSRAGMMFAMRGRFPAEHPDLPTLVANWDKFVPIEKPRQRAGDRAFEDYPEPGRQKLKP